MGSDLPAAREFIFRRHPDDGELWPYHIECDSTEPAEYVLPCSESEFDKAAVARANEDGYELKCPTCQKKYAVRFFGENVLVTEVAV